MEPAPALWIVRKGAAANADFKSIVRWTAARFGHAQARVYAKTIDAALQELSAGPDIIGSKALGDFAPGIYMLHVARKGRAGRHFVVFRAHCSQDQNVIDVLRLLHDSMDLTRHLPPG
ncbi:MAG: type II toxin-antitoxin system RelE/ParE family toxin [Rhodoferax sp.]|nr:type II toxin-antitoxin system RelE/ParE family toxin [Rhodoferax sp.]